MPRYSLVVFDFDGTLVDSATCIRQSLTRAIEQQGLAIRSPVLTEWIGLPLTTMINSSCGEVDADTMAAVIAGYRVHYAALDPGLTFAFPGMPGTLSALAAQGTQLAVGTNKHSTPARATLERLGIDELFAAIVGADHVARPKPHPDILLRVLELTGSQPVDALMVGDASVDLQMAAAAGVDSCAVTWGNHSREQLLAANPTYVIDSPRALLDTITR
jgi:2-phosphoglycolate phosphatase